ncbi:hypothetical protein ABZ069_37145 [Streptomyces microflavus]|uniref:hypothetical protein n=1 Tax=Streptomyces microflavus TaxID=1919 RepID=UPI0033BB4B34
MAASRSLRDDPENLIRWVLFDLASAGFSPAPPPPLSPDDSGGVTAYVNDDGHVVVGLLTHNRLETAALDTWYADTADAGPFTGDVRARYDTVQEVMDTALCAILHTFGYNPRPAQLFGFDHIIHQPDSVTRLAPPGHSPLARPLLSDLA